MDYIDFESLTRRTSEIKNDFNSKKPFRFTMFEGFFKPEKAQIIYSQYPEIKDGTWDGTTYIDQKNKFQKTKFESGSVFERAFAELNSAEFLKWLEAVTGINDLQADAELFGGGLHQSIKGAFLNVHIDYNFHPTTKYHRRLNVLVYMNKEWKDEYNGFLELWDLSDSKKIQIGNFAPLFNRCVIFETNEISYHGHPKPLNTPVGFNRKSLATYYYTKERDAHTAASEHNTIYVNTEGVAGQVKRFTSGIKAFFERIKKK